MKKLILSACAIVCAASIFGQGTVTFNNHVAGSVVTHIYAPLASAPWTWQQGNGTADTPAGTTDWSGWTLLAGSGYTAQLWAAPGLNQPESSLEPASPTTVMRTGGGAGYVAGVTTTLSNILPDSTGGATLEVRVWDNRGGTVTSWAAAFALMMTDSTYALGSSPLFNLTATIGGTFNTPPNLVGLQSFNILPAIGPEPSTLALAALGAAALLFSRRHGWISGGRRGSSSNHSHVTTDV
jgi:hypothetical protein